MVTILGPSYDLKANAKTKAKTLEAKQEIVLKGDITFR
jgi:hypothetical protein